MDAKRHISGRSDTHGFVTARRARGLPMVVAAITACIFNHGVSAQSNGSGQDLRYYAGKNDGWFFYNDPKPVKAPKPEPPPPPPEPPPAAPQPTPVKPFSVEWLRAKMPIMLDNSINEPTKENVQAYMYAQRLMLDLTDNFKSAAEKVVASDPYLNEEFRVPTATFVKRDTLYAVSKAKSQIVTDLSASSGLWFFFDSKCAYCKAQYQTLQRVQKDAGFQVKNISLDGASLPGMKDFVVDRDKKVFTRFGLLLTPAVVLVSPPDKFLVVAHGAMAENELLDKIVIAASDQHLVPKELTDIANLEHRGIVTPDEVASMRAATQDSDDPKVLVKMMQDAIQGRLQ